MDDCLFTKLTKVMAKEFELIDIELMVYYLVIKAKKIRGWYFHLIIKLHKGNTQKVQDE